MKIRPFIAPVILWGYVLSVVVARGFWDETYDRAIRILDLNQHQGWIIPVAIDLFVACIGLQQSVLYIISLRKRDAITISRHVACSLCIVGLCLNASTGLRLGLAMHKEILTAAKESLGGEGQQVFDAGDITNDFYTNEIVGVSLELPKGWHPMTLNSMRRAKYSGALKMSGNDLHHAEEISAFRPGRYMLLSTHEYPQNHPDYNPSLFLNAYDKRAVAADGYRTFEAYVDSYKNVSEPHHVRLGPIERSFGNETGYYIHIEARLPEIVIQQHVYLFESDQYYISVTVSIVDEDEINLLEKEVSTICLRRTAKK